MNVKATISDAIARCFEEIASTHGVAITEVSISWYYSHRIDKEWPTAILKEVSLPAA